MQQTSFLNYTNFHKYLMFVEECKSKQYDNELVLHRHHIIPSFIDIDGTESHRIVNLSVQDHIEAHRLLSICFEDGSSEQIGNLRAVKLLSKNSLKYKKELLKIYENQRGENNPAKRPEVRKKISEGLRAYFKNNEPNKKGKSYEEIYGERAEEERRKRAKCTRSKDQYIESAKKASKKLKGKKSWNAVEIKFNGIKYRSIKQASEITGISSYYIKKEIQNEKDC